MLFMDWRTVRASPSGSARFAPSAEKVTFCPCPASTPCGPVVPPSSNSTPVKAWLISMSAQYPSTCQARRSATRERNIIPELPAVILKLKRSSKSPTSPPL
jgi:hypothetical protein